MAYRCSKCDSYAVYQVYPVGSNKKQWRCAGCNSYGVKVKK